MFLMGYLKQMQVCENRPDATVTYLFKWHKQFKAQSDRQFFTISKTRKKQVRAFNKNR